MSTGPDCFVCTTNPAMPDDFGPGYPVGLIEAEKGRCESCALFAVENVAQMMVAEIARLRAGLEAVRARIANDDPACIHVEEREIIDRALRGGA